MGTNLAILIAAVAVVLAAAIALLLRHQIGLYFKLKRWPSRDDLAAAQSVRAVRRQHNARVNAAKVALGEAEKAHRDRVKTAERQWKSAQRVRAQALEEAAKAVRSAEMERERAIASAQASLNEWQNPGSGRQLGTYQDVTLWENQIRTAQGTSPIAGTDATVDTAGNLMVTKRVTLTRLVALSVIGGPLFGAIGALLFQKKQKDDVRELYLLVETANFASVTKCSADAGQRVRQFAARINTAALQASKREEQRPAMVASYEAELRQATQNVNAVEAAQQRLAVAEADRRLLTPIEEAQSALALIQADSTEIQIRQKELATITGFLPADSTLIPGIEPALAAPRDAT